MINCVAEQIKIRLQIQETSMNGSKSNAFAIAKLILKDGGIRSLFRGTGLTFLRDVPTGFAYFGTYEGLKRQLRDEQGKASIPAVLFSGGCAGMINWTLAIPIDTIKSRIQSSSKNVGFNETIIELFRRSGIKGFFRGLAPTLLRAFPASASLFFGVEMSRNMLDKIFN